MADERSTATRQTWHSDHGSVDLSGDLSTSVDHIARVSYIAIDTASGDIRVNAADAGASGKVKASSASGRVFVGHPGATLGDIAKDANLTIGAADSKNALMNICSASGSIGIQLA